jgi:hypothetical protein
MVLWAKMRVVAVKGGRLGGVRLLVRCTTSNAAHSYIIDHKGFPQNHNWVTTLMKGCSEALRRAEPLRVIFARIVMLQRIWHVSKVSVGKRR